MRSGWCKRGCRGLLRWRQLGRHCLRSISIFSFRSPFVSNFLPQLERWQLPGFSVRPAMANQAMAMAERFWQTRHDHGHGDPQVTSHQDLMSSVRYMLGTNNILQSFMFDCNTLFLIKKGRLGCQLKSRLLAEFYIDLLDLCPTLQMPLAINSRLKYGWRRCRSKMNWGCTCHDSTFKYLQLTEYLQLTSACFSSLPVELHFGLMANRFAFRCDDDIFFQKGMFTSGFAKQAGEHTSG